MENVTTKRALLRDFREQRDRDAAHVNAVDRYGIRLRVNGNDVTDSFQQRRRELLAELDGIIEGLESELQSANP